MKMLRSVAGSRDPITDDRLAATSRRADVVAAELGKLADTPNPITGRRDPFGALVHAMRGTLQHRQAQDGGQ